MSDASRPTRSLDAAYFDRIYADEVDPWGFESRPYEQEKYARTIAALPRAHYRRCFEVGCSVGVLSGRLLALCDELVATDINDRALARARELNAAAAGAQFLNMNFPEEVPAGTFDLVVLSEVAYYWAEESFARAQDLIVSRLLEAEGTLVLVHYTPTDTDYPMTGDEVHARYLARAVGPHAVLAHVDRYIGSQYRLDVFRKLRGPHLPTRDASTTLRG